ncbi:MAG: energy transducer TonB [Spirochaetota bacterium]|nr:energy transducer TonB [Spirochaetota bacterium]
MEKNAEIKISLIVLISFFVHLIFALGVFMPVYNEFMRIQGLNERSSGNRDVIVNINQDDRRVESRNTLMSDRDSSAKGHITKDKGDHWLNNFRDFILKRGKQNVGKTSDKSMDVRDKTGILVTDNTEVIIRLMKYEIGNIIGDDGVGEFTKIPDKNEFNRKNAIFYSTDGRFSFNTQKYKNFKYFKKLKDKVASHWFPPLLANSIIAGFDPLTGSYTPGRVRIMAIPNQLVKIYFTMNREGDVLDVVLVESMGNGALDSSCIDAIQLSRNFGEVPSEIKGNIVVIPFMFGYFVY